MSNIKTAVATLRQQINCRNKNKILLQASTIAQLKQSDDWEAIYLEFLQSELLSLGYTEMLMVIANSPSLISLNYCEYLPNSYKILYELSHLTESQLIEAIGNGLVEKTMSLTKAKKLRQQAAG